MAIKLKIVIEEDGLTPTETEIDITDVISMQATVKHLNRYFLRLSIENIDNMKKYKL